MNSPPSNSEDKRSAAFERFHDGVKRWIWEQGWSQLHPIQEAAARAILEADRDVIIGAPTAGGKTEAAFLPIASVLGAVPEQGIGCVCVSPLKALINDQADRLEPLFERVGVPLTPWHGDIAQSVKNKLLKKPRGVLITTPESLEAMFVLRGNAVSSLFSDVRFVVVDELHSFIGQERGRQLQSLLNRLELAVRRRIPRVALSATLGDMTLAAEALRPGEASGVSVIEASERGAELKLQVRGYIERAPAEDRGDAPEPASVRPHPVAQDLFKLLRGADNLVFANSRARVEDLTDQLAWLSEAKNVPNEFLAHHGNLSREIREDAERRVKDDSKPTTVLCTTTLELGIDVGNVRSIAQIGPPPSVSSLRQRLGRSGRRGGAPSILRAFVIAEEIDPHGSLVDELRAQLFQTIAVIELLIEGWCEPPAPDRLHLSTLVQQILSVIAQHGGASARDLHRSLCVSGPFRMITSELFGRLLRCLGEGSLLTQVSDGDLTLGVRGEEIVDHYSFYTAFATPEEFRLVTGSRTLGTMPLTDPVMLGAHLLFAGRRWLIVAIDEASKVIEVQPAAGRRLPAFESVGGFNVHDRVREKMLEVYAGAEVPVYLDRSAQELLAQGRAAFVRSRLIDQRLIEESGGVLIFPWKGDRVVNTLALQLQSLGLSAWTTGLVVGLKGASVDDAWEGLQRVARGDVPKGVGLAALVPATAEEKYDWALSPDLRCEGYASRRLDERGARATAADLIGRANTGDPS